jgi:hypothetical protein
MLPTGYLKYDGPDLLSVFDGWYADLYVASLTPHRTLVFRLMKDSKKDPYFLVCIACCRVESVWHWRIGHLDVTFSGSSAALAQPKWLLDGPISDHPFCKTIISDSHADMKVYCGSGIVLGLADYETRFKNTPPFG